MKLPKNLLWEQIDLINYLNSQNSPLILNLINTAPIFYKNKISTIHDLAFKIYPEFFSKSFSLLYNFLIPRVLKSSKKIFTVSEYSKSSIVNEYRINPNQIYVIYNSVSSKFKPQKDNSNKKYILSVGSIEPRKNLNALIKAFNLLNRDDLKLIIVGEKNRVFKDEEIKLNKNIEFSGYVSDNELNRLYSNAICFCYLSIFEGFGIPPLEAQACEIPILISNTSSLPEVFADSALYANPFDIEDIKDKIELLVDDKSLQKELIEKGKNNLKRFSWQKSAKEVYKVLKEFSDNRCE